VRFPARGRLRAVSGLILAVLVTLSCGVSPPGSIPSPHGTVVGAGLTKDPNSPYATTREAWLLGIKVCLAAQGIDVTVDLADGSILFLGPDAQVTQTSVEEKKCARSVDPTRYAVNLPKPSTAQLQAMYAFMVDKGTCLRDAGYPVTAAPPEQVFIDSSGYWDPEASLPQEGVHPSKADRLRCGHLPSRPTFLDW
jgi:hypothetical protein